MALIEAKGRPQLVCGKCKIILILPESLDLDERQEVARRRRAGPAATTRYLVEHHGLDLREAKAIVVHIPPTMGKCTRCRTPIPKGDISCPKCRSLNLNW